MYMISQKAHAQSCVYIFDIFTGFQNSFSGTLTWTFAVTLALKITPNLQHATVVQYPVI